MGREVGLPTLAIDPGEIHCGVAWFDLGGECQIAGEVRPFTLFHQLETDLDLQQVILEEFRLYPWKMKEQGFSQIKTAEVIGVVKYICQRRALIVVEQPASIKKPVEGIVRAKGIVLRSSGHGPHAKDAELHGLYFFKEKGWASFKSSSADSSARKAKARLPRGWHGANTKASSQSE